MSDIVARSLGSAISVIGKEVAETIGPFLAEMSIRGADAPGVIKFVKMGMASRRGALTAYARPKNTPGAPRPPAGTAFGALRGRSVVDDYREASPESFQYFRELDLREKAMAETRAVDAARRRARVEESMVTAVNPKTYYSPGEEVSPGTAFEQSLIRGEETIEYQVEVQRVLALLKMFDMLEHTVLFAPTRPTIRQLRARVFRFTVLADPTHMSLLSPDWYRVDSMVEELRRMKLVLLEKATGRSVRPETTISAIEGAVVLLRDDADRLASCWERDLNNGEIETDPKTVAVLRNRKKLY